MDFKGYLSPINRPTKYKPQTHTLKPPVLSAPLEGKKQSKKSVALLYAAAFIIPIIIMLIVYICIGIYPFGDKSLLTIDLYHQYIDFLSYYRQSLSSLSFSNFFYSFSKSLGGNMLGLYAYYLASPFNVMLLFFTAETLAEGILLITLLKIGCCGVAFTYMCRAMFKKYDYFALVFSSCYALMAYNIVFQQNIMWLDGVIWLPVIVTGIYRLVNENGFILYILSLTIALMSNYYIGYMLCIFSVLFFIYQMIIGTGRTMTRKDVFTKIFLFCVSSLIAGGIAAWLLVPTFSALLGGKATVDAARFTFADNFKFSQFLQKLFIGEMDIDLLHQGLDTTLPDIFCGTIITITAMLYYFNKKISFREKMATSFMLFVLFVSLHLKTFNLIWHGLSTPVGFLYRNSFIVSFFAIYMGYITFLKLDGLKKGNLLTVIGIFTALGIFVNNYSLETLTSAEIYLTVFFFMLYAVIISVLISGKRNAYILVALMMIVTVEFEISGVLTLEDLSHVSRDTYTSEVTAMEKALARIKAIDNGFYRIDKTYMRSRNDGMMHGYPTITHSSSTTDFALVEFLNKLGFRNESNIGNSYDYGNTLPINSLLSIKYVLDNTNSEFIYFEDKGYSDANHILKNPYALPLMFKANKQVLSTQNSYDIFMIQNDLFSYMTGYGDVLTEITGINVKMHNLTKTISDGNGNYTKTNEDDDAYIEFTFTAINDEEIYAHFPTEPISDSTVDVYVNEKKLRQHFDSDHLTYYDLLCLGHFEKGETVTLRFELQEDETNFEAYNIYALNMDNFQKAYNALSQDPMSIEILSQNHIKATVENVGDNQLVFTSIPYDKGWRVYVDGQKVEASAVLDRLLVIETGAGSHTIEMKYTPPGFYAGLAVSIGALIALMLFAGLTKKHRK